MPIQQHGDLRPPRRVRADSKGLRTLIFHPALSPYRIDLFNHLARELDLRLVLLNRAPSYYSVYNQAALESGLKCDYEFLPEPRCWLGSKIRIGLDETVRRFRPQVVCTSEFSDVTLRMMLWRRFGAAEDFGHVLGTDESPAMLESRGRVRRWLRHLRCRCVDSVIVCSPAVKQCLVRRRWLSEERIFVCGVHQSPEAVGAKLDAGRALASRVIQEHGLRGRKIILFVGRLVENKDPMRLLDAFGQTRAAHPDGALVYVGSGPLEATLKARVAASGLAPGDIIFTGNVEGAELYVWYALSHVLVRPSIFEPYGAVVNEALLCGVPAICSSAVGACELIREGKNGHIFRPLDTDSLAALLAHALRSAVPAEALAEQRRESLMPVSFADDVSSFVRAIEHAWSCRQRRRRR